MSINASQDYVHIFEDQFFLRVIFRRSYETIVGHEGCFGVRKRFSFVTLEYYTSRKEPHLSPVPGIRIAFWFPYGDVVVDNTWHTTWPRVTKDTYAVMDISNVEESVNGWNETARRYVRQYESLHEERYSIREVTDKIFLSAYVVKSNIKTTIKRSMMECVRAHHKIDKDRMKYYCLFDKNNNEYVAGVTVLQSRDVNQIYYVAGFVDKREVPPQGMIWLIYYAIKKGSELGLKYCNLGVMYTQGDPLSWKGFSRFKKKFNPVLIGGIYARIRMTFGLKG
ncbi:MAG: hypothetical protein RI935_653 [Candidatus Parcubacteria bacterium]|jgi:hypothetical protein